MCCEGADAAEPGDSEESGGMADVVGLESIDARCERLEARAGELMGAMNVITAGLVGLIGEVDQAGLGNWAGVRSLSHWLCWRCGLSPARARRLVAIAGRLEDLPVAAEAVGAGDLSEEQMRLVCEKTPQERDGEVTHWAKVMLFPQLRRILAHLPQQEADTEADTGGGKRPVLEDREVSFGTSEDGASWMARLLLPADEGALVEMSWRRGRDAAFAEANSANTINDNDSVSGDDENKRRVSWADGVTRAAEAALEGLDAGIASGRRPAHRHQVIYHLPLEHPDSFASGSGGGLNPACGGHVHGAKAIPDWLARYVSCDCTTRWVLESKGRPVAVSSRSDTVDPLLRTLIEERDRICRVPGCSQARWLHIHHMTHVHDGGVTEPANLVAICPFHHRQHHQGRLTISGDPETVDGLTFTDRWGRQILQCRPPAPPEDPDDIGDIRHSWQPPLGEPLYARDFIWNTHPPRNPPEDPP